MQLLFHTLLHNTWSKNTFPIVNNILFVIYFYHNYFYIRIYYIIILLFFSTIGSYNLNQWVRVLVRFSSPEIIRNSTVVLFPFRSNQHTGTWRFPSPPSLPQIMTTLQKYLFKPWLYTQNCFFFFIGKRRDIRLHFLAL